MQRERLAVLVCTALVVLTVAAYIPLWQTGFIFDDDTWIIGNPNVRGGLTAKNVREAWTAFHEGYWVPLTWMSLQLDASLSPRPDSSASTVFPSAVICHGQNLLWHAASVVLLFWLLWRLTGWLGPSAVVAALFAVHPLHVESVAWATERKDVLSTFFLLLTLAAYRRYVQQPSGARYALVLLAFVLGLLAKPMLVTLPLVLLLLDFWPLGRLSEAWRRARGQGTKPDRRPLLVLLLEKVPLLIAAAGASVMMVLAQRSANALYSLSGLSVSSRLANAVLSYGWYLEKTFWPTDLAIFYPHARGSWSWTPVLLCGAMLAMITIAVLASARRWPWLTVGWLWFLGTLVPVIGLVQAGAQAHADRYTYVPHIGFFLALIWSGAALLSQCGLPRFVQGVLAAACVLILAGLTWVQLGYWRNPETMWEHTLAVTTDNYRAHLNLGNALRLRALTPGQEDPALLGRSAQEYAKAVALEPEDFRLRFNFGMVLLIRGELREAEREFAEAARQNPTDDTALYNLAAVQSRLGRPVDAEWSLRRALRISPSGSDLRALLGTALWEQRRHQEAVQEWQRVLSRAPGEPEALTGMGLDALRQGKAAQAAQCFLRAAQTDPTPARWSLLGVACGRMGQWEQAIRAQAQALQMEESYQRMLARPRTTEPALYHRRLAYALASLGRSTEAAAAYAVALKLDPDWPRSATAQAWQLATASDEEARDPATAEELAQQVCQASARPGAEALDALAAAQAATGHFKEAAATARQAQAQAPPTLAKLIEQRAKLYKSGKVFRTSKSALP